MAINPAILQQIGVRDNAQALNIFQNALVSGQQRKRLNAQEARRAELQPFAVQQQKQAAQKARRAEILTSMNDFAVGNASLIQRAQQTGDSSQLHSAFVQRRQQLIQQGLPTETTDEAIQLIEAGKTGEVISGLGDAVNLFNQGRKGQQKSLGQREFDSNVAAVKADPNLETIEGRAASIALGMTAKASLTKEERIARDKELADLIVKQKGAEASAIESAKLTQQKKFKPQIARLVKEAERQASQQGETLSDLARMKATMPTLKETISQLKDLSSLATSTIGGRAFDFALKESGFGSTKGADARAKLIAIVSNQVLPLLKETFGSAFTEGEGKRLEASLVDPDASPTQKVEQLTSFIEQKERNILAAEQRLKNLQQQEIPLGVSPVQVSAVNADVPETDLTNLSIEELIAERNRLGGK